MNLVKSITTVGSYTVISRITGFARDMLIANYLGAGVIADAFFVAFRFPNLFRRLFAEGAFSAAFVPLFTRLRADKSKEEAENFANLSLSFLTLILFLVVVGMILLMPWAMYLLAPGFTQVPGKFELAIVLSQIAFPYLLFISQVSLLCGVLNSYGRFAAAAAVPIILNLSLMASLWLLSPYLPNPGYALVWGTSLAGIFQLVWLLLACKRAGIRVEMPKPKLSPEVRLLLQRIIPGALGAGIYQVNLLVGTILASTLAQGAVSYLYYADRVNQLPLGVVGVAVATVLLPILSRDLGNGDKDKANHSQNRGLEFSLLLTLPATFGLLGLAYPIISLLFEHGAFGHKEALETAYCLQAYALGLPAYVLIKALTPAFFAREDTKTPVKIATWSMVLNLGLNFVLMLPLGHIGIALSSSISAWINCLALAIILKKHGFLRPDYKLKRNSGLILVLSLLMGGLCYGMDMFLSLPLSLRLALDIAAGAGFFFAAAYFARVLVWTDLKRIIGKRKA